MGKWTLPKTGLHRKFHPIFGWGVAEQPGPKGGTLFYPECAVDWYTATPLMGGRPDHVEHNEPVYMKYSELRDTDEMSDADTLCNMALVVKRTPPSNGI